MAKRKSRAAGGGRKPQGEFSQLTSPFSLRMPDGLRGQLEAAAKKSGRSASQELLARLNSSFARERDQGRDPATRALCFLLAELADKIRWPKSRTWQRDPFIFKAFKMAFAQVLDALEPSGEVNPPFPRLALADKWREQWKSPETIANDVAQQTLSDLYRISIAPPQSPFAHWLTDENEDARAAARYDIAVRERTHYGMADVRRDLRLAKLKKGGSVKD
jgi:Arc-like DNA binding domain